MRVVRSTRDSCSDSSDKRSSIVDITGDKQYTQYSSRGSYYICCGICL